MGDVEKLFVKWSDYKITWRLMFILFCFATSMDALSITSSMLRSHSYDLFFFTDNKNQTGFCDSLLKYYYRIEHEYPHDTAAYSQGLVFINGYFYESTGQYGQSSIRKVKPETGEILQAINSPDSVFGEGLTCFQNQLIQLTWKSGVAYTMDLATFKNIRVLPYTVKEGWGLTNDGHSLLMSDGTSSIYFLNPADMRIRKKINVNDGQREIDQLNELEFINGEIWANVFTKDLVVRIDPESGKVLGEIDFSGLLNEKEKNIHVDVLNGIAWDRETGRIFVTGKNWPKVYEVSIHQKL